MLADGRPVYTDGACRGNPGPGGWAWLVPEGPSDSGGEPETTNQRMELTAVLRAIESLDGPLAIVSDSTYVVNCFRDRWWEGWLRRGWVNSQKKPVANRDLWEPLVDLYRAREHEISFRWVKGHSGDRWNDEVDRMATEQADRFRPDDGADSGGRAGGSAGSTSAIEGRKLAVVGLRSADLEDDAELRRKLTEIVAAKKQLHPDLVVLSGLRHGAEALGAQAALDVGVPFVAVLPYPEPDRPWPPAARRRFADMLDLAADVTTLQRKQPESAKDAKGALDRRDAWFGREADEAIVVWDGEDAGVGILLAKLERALGDDVWLVEVDAGRD